MSCINDSPLLSDHEKWKTKSHFELRFFKYPVSRTSMHAHFQRLTHLNTRTPVDPYMSTACVYYTYSTVMLKQGTIKYRLCISAVLLNDCRESKPLSTLYSFIH
ncbi:unnamed protein product [Albugo candida]|uniref:Uncharacterized protein n=1 Tax=Albugo candida TaxID=65357 RepID=A0A024GLU0_9STRA|nr:unnamed protein product [Albugo candida]|eukprot:CCI47460.1 unnamed protein product [Albugo candida]